MKQLLLFVSAALAAVVLTPKSASLDQAILSVDEPHHEVESSAPGWWDSVTNDERFHALANSLENAGDAISHVLFDDDDHHDHDHDHDHDKPRHPGHGHDGHHHHGDASKTIYDQLKESKYTTRFAALVDEHSDIKGLLQSTKTNRTLFVPTDKAFERIPPDHEKPPAEFIRAVLAYSIAPGLWSSRRLFFSHTTPTELKLDDLGGYPQRLRISAGVLSGLRINLFTRVIAKDIIAKNGLIHAVDHILVPPPSTSKIIQLLPNTFSTFSLGLTTTGLGEEISELKWLGGTAFVPTNRAFTRLGPRANAFLFSERGKKYLKALLKYSLVANETLYSDAYYKSGGDDDDEDATKPGGSGYWHVDLPSLLDDKPISVDVKRWKGFIDIVANGYTHVALQDVIGEDGVLQVVNSVLFPPRRPGHHHGEEESDDDDREWSVEELVERLEGYVQESALSRLAVNDL
ncbi:hypothetical protein OQA88_4982 [Cercophora sp. LCS_1]